MAYGEQIMLADKSPLFCIDGTVAHLHCRINAVHNYSDVVDEDHHDVIYALARPRSRKQRGISDWRIDECCGAWREEHGDIQRLETGI